MVTLWQKRAQLNIREKLFGYEVDQTLEEKVLGGLWLQKAICLGKEPRYKGAGKGQGDR